MPAWLLPAITGLAGAAGQLFTNQSNRRMARDQMAFQEQMSSTSAQRATRDYGAAGLNPALAYGNPASSPGGSTALMGNALEAGARGIASAQAYNRTRKELELLEAQTMAAKGAAMREASQSTLNLNNAALADQAYQFNKITQPSDAIKRAAEAAIYHANVQGAQTRGKLWRTGDDLLNIGTEGWKNLKDWTDREYWNNTFWNPLSQKLGSAKSALPFLNFGGSKK